MIKLILFDIDGTMIRSAGAGSMAFGRAFGTLFNLPEGAALLDGAEPLIDAHRIGKI